MSTPKFISKLHDEALEMNGEIHNFASMLRTRCVLHLRNSHPSQARAGLARRQAA